MLIYLLLRLIIILLLCFFCSLVLTPIACLPQGVFGYFIPIGLWPSPPPWGWSTGFMALPRTLGRQPISLFLPALPILTFIQSAFANWPTVASPASFTFRISPLGIFKRP